MNKIIKPFRKLPILQILLISLLSIFLTACLSDKKSKKASSAIEIITETMDFQTVDKIPSGWHTFRYINKSHETHFFLLDKYPEGKTIIDGELEVLPTFQSGMDLINEGKDSAGFAEFNKLPSWFFEVVFSGGSGLVSPGEIAETTVKLEPGYYVIECYVKMSNGTFHSSMGMVKELIVSADSSGSSPLKPDVKINISSTEGILFTGPINKGKQTFSVHFMDQITHENFVGHDIHLVRLNEDANIETLEKWMNWADPEGLITPSPKGVTFLGGVNDMPAGGTGYFETRLYPGNYAFVSEVPNALSKNMLKTFVVSE